MSGGIRSNYSLAFSGKNDPNTAVTTLNKIDPRSAAKNPSTRNPGTTAAASISINALITNETNPSVRTRKGHAKNLITAPKVAFMNPIAAAAISADTKPETETPGTKYVTTNSATALNNHRNSRFVIGRPFYRATWLAGTPMT